MQDQKKVWNSIAPEWYEFKNKPSPQNIEFVKNQKGKLLDLGCGSGRNFTKTQAEIYAVDFSEEMIEYSKKKAKNLGIKKIKFQVSPSWEIPYENEFFDSVIAISMLHCVETKEKRLDTLKEIYRVLKKQGKFRLSVWNKDSGRFKKKKKEDFVKWRDKGDRYYYFYSQKEILKDLEKIGFKVIEIFPPGVNLEFILEK